MSLLGNLFLLLGAVFCFLGALGLVRMPDPYTRIQAGTKAVTLGTVSLLLGIALLRPEWWPKLLLVGFFVLLTNPIGSSVLARAFHKAGVPMWRKPGSEQ